MAAVTFAQTLKTREVEDPINLWVHRPLAYGFVRLVLPTPLSANAVTFLAIGVGVVAAALLLIGTPSAMLLGAILLWSSAILDGADGMLARARGAVSPFGRAIDGTADLIVIGASVVAGGLHLFLQTRSVLWAILASAAIGSGLYHFATYDFYKEWFLRMTRPDRSDHETIASVREAEGKLKSERGPFFTRFAMGSLRSYLQGQDNFAKFTNPRGRREGRIVPRATPQIAEIFRRENLGPMRLWAWLSPAPHADFFCLAAAIDRIDLYVFTRLLLLNAVFVAAIVSQRRATERTFDELERLGLAEPVPTPRSGPAPSLQ